MKHNTIILKNYSNIFLEYVSAAVVTPGELLELTTAGFVQDHSTAGGNVLGPMFAIEDALQGKAIWDNYASGALVRVWIPTRGDEVYAILADGQHIEIGEALESNASGYLQKWTGDAGDSTNATKLLSIVGYALEAKDLSGDSSAVESEGDLATNQRIKIRIV
jgi:hypothetical protein